MNGFRKLLLLVLPLFFTAWGCNPTKKLGPGQYLLESAEVKSERIAGVDREELEAFFRQKPNRKLFGRFHFFVWWYNRFNPQTVAEKKFKRNVKYDRTNARRVKKAEKKNEKRLRKGKTPRQAKLKDKENATFLESLRDIGEPPVIHDSLFTEQTRLQLNKLLFSKGYYNSEVSDSVKTRNKRAHVTYYLRPGAPYRISSIRYKMDDPELGQQFLKDTVNSLLRPGMLCDADRLQAERQRLTDYAVNNGYFYFENPYIDYNLDTAFSNHTAVLTLHLKKFGRPYQGDEDSVEYVNHPKFRIKNVYIITEPFIGNPRNGEFRDTVISSRKKLTYLLNHPLKYTRKIISINTDVYPGQWYRKDSAQQTYKQLSGLGIFRSVNLKFYPAGSNLLDCYIVCNPLNKQSLTTETGVNNSSVHYGIDGNILYQNRNFFRGGELLQLKLSASISAQKGFNDTTTIQGENIATASSYERFFNTFNTIQFGPELSFSVPRAFFPFSLLPFRKDQQPRTYIKTSLNYQTRPDFNRTISLVDYGFSFITHNKQLKHDVIPFEIYQVRARLTQSFRDSLRKLNDAFLLNSFLDHITTLSRYTIAFTSKESGTSSRRTSYFARLNLQSSGSILRALYKATGQPTDTAGRYLLSGVPFAQFLRTDVDFRIYVPIRKRSRVVYRLAAGIGQPLKNLNVLPYEQSFFTGGPNSNRAWRARTLGPGGYYPTAGNTTRFDKIGDILLEGNFEYRFHIIRAFNGAMFIDAGNIWRLRPDPTKPGAEFYADKFLDQIAVGGGFGIRWDLTFFVLRLDLGVPLKEPRPAVLEGAYKPVLQKNKWWTATVLNFGIGYPF